VGADGIRLERRIDSLMAEAIRQSATPGGQVLLAKDGKVVFQKAYGHHTYSGSTPVTTESVYDLASLTKVLASLPAAMRLNGEGRFELHRRVKDYLPDAAGTNKGNLVWTDILTHQAGLQPYVPLYDRVLKKPYLLSDSKSADYPLPVAEGRYAWFAMPDTVRQWTYDFPLRYRSNIYRPFGYKYSDTGFYLLMWALEGMTNQALDAYVAEQFYAPLGLPTLGYRPLERLPKARLVPTELDRKYRGGLLQGYVDDPGASLLGGVAGHAGLFANARDVAVMMQLFLQDGAYGGRQYWRTGTMAKFNTRPYEHSNDNRRAIGWDKPVLKGHGGATSPYASHDTFGHTGFTGTSAWADPKRQLVCVFLSNRIHPYIGNNKLVVGDFREQAMTIFYEALGISEMR
jgi:CubicO group peptidase (beta-lactamase class C family)